MAMAMDWREDRHITHRSFRIVDILDVGEDILTGRTFENCTIYGPAVLAPLNQVAFEHNTFEASQEALFWEIPEIRNQMLGAIGLTDCTFRRCIFRGIGIAGKRALIQQFVSADTP